jgi:hypothetical protein
MNTFSKTYVQNHKTEIMKLYSVIYTMLEFDVIIEKRNPKLIDDAAVFYTMMSFLYYNNITCLDTLDKLRKEKKIQTNQFHCDFIAEIKEMVRQHEQTLKERNENK